MTIVKVSPKYQVVIPKEIRESMHIKPGQEICMIMYDGRIELIPILPMEQARGMLKGIETNIEREEDRI